MSLDIRRPLLSLTALVAWRMPGPSSGSFRVVRRRTVRRSWLGKVLRRLYLLLASAWTVLCLRELSQVFVPPLPYFLLVISLSFDERLDAFFIKGGQRSTGRGTFSPVLQGCLRLLTPRGLTADFSEVGRALMSASSQLAWSLSLLTSPSTLILLVNCLLCSRPGSLVL
nr:MAG: hypothetical protein [Botourmiaviridae sp.]WAK78013.1 MAG: hypothetical protein [Botourmiaviridae sp.]